MDDQVSALTPNSEPNRSTEPHEQVAQGAKPAPPSVGPTQPTHASASPAPVLIPMMIANGLGFPGAPAGVSGLSVQQVQVWQGQFPPPEAVERYNIVLPGAFDRIIGMAERQQAASIQGAAEARLYLREDSRRGHWLGWLVTVAAIVGAIFCATIHEPWVAGMLVAVPVMGVAKALIDSAKTSASAPVAIATQPPAAIPTKPDTPKQAGGD